MEAFHHSGSFRFQSSLVILLAIVFRCVTSQECPPSSRAGAFRASANETTLLTPGFRKGRYVPNLDCHWVLKASSANSRVVLSVSASSLEDRIFTECDDFIQVRDGETSSSMSLAKWCGHTHPLSVISNSGSLYVQFKSDAAFELRGANLSFVEFSLPGCPPGWRRWASNCYLFVAPKLKFTWLQAQQQCIYYRSNLLAIASQLEYAAVLELYNSYRQYPWVGVTDAAKEGQFNAIDANANLWPNPSVIAGTFFVNLRRFSFPEFDDHENRDCVYLDFTSDGSAYKVDDCRAQRSFICKRAAEGNTVPYPAPTQTIRNGYVEEPAGLALAPFWLLGLVLLLLLLLILVPCCFGKKRSRVSQSASDSVGALLPPSTAVDSPRAPPPPPRAASPLRSVSRMVEQTFEADELRLKADTVDTAALNGGALLVAAAAPDERANGVPARYRRRAAPLPPVDCFDRPHVRALDNVSAISMDEFWQKMDAAAPRSAETGRTML